MSLKANNTAYSRRSCLALSAAVMCLAPRWTSPASARDRQDGHGPRGESARWRTLPKTPKLPIPPRTGVIEVNGTTIYYAQFGAGRHLLMLHGGMANSNYWGLQVGELAKRYCVTVMDTRGHGRSPYDGEKLGYQLFASDALKLLDGLGIGEADLVGWSDGAITALLVAAAAPKRVGRLFAFGANISRSGLIPGGAHSATFRSFAARCASEYRALSPMSRQWPRLLSELGRMWREQPEIAPELLRRITCPCLIADGQHDEIIRAEHTAHIAKCIAGSRMWIQPDVSHFAMLQAPDEFNRGLIDFLPS